jgi:hypothetical protein
VFFLRLEYPMLSSFSGLSIFDCPFGISNIYSHKLTHDEQRVSERDEPCVTDDKLK